MRHDRGHPHQRHRGCRNCAGHRRHRLHRRPPGPAAPGGGPHREGAGPDTGQNRRRAVAGRRRSGAEQPRRRRRAAGGAGRGRRAVLPGPFHGCRRQASRPRKKPWPRLAAQAAAAAGVSRIVYLGGLHPSNVELSTHMRSREAVGKVFLDSPVDAVVFQAGVVIGSGSASFEMIRHLAETLPLMPAPSWVRNRIEAIAVRDVLHYLVGAASLQEPINRTFDIGCRQVLSYAGMMKEYAAEAGLPHRVVLALPIPAPKLAGMWVALTTPDSAVHVRCRWSSRCSTTPSRREHDIDQLHPAARRRPDSATAGPSPWRSARNATARWKPPGPTPASTPIRCPAIRTGPATRFTWMSGPSTATSTPRMCGPSSRASAARTAGIPCRSRGSVRGWLDKLTGGAGLLRGRRHPAPPRPGEVVDWWRVERIDRGRLLRLRAEMRAPGPRLA